MISRYTRIQLLSLVIAFLSACGSGGQSSSGTSVKIGFAPVSPELLAPETNQSFTNDLGTLITLEQAYLVIASATIESSCGGSFSALLDSPILTLISSASAHTTSTPMTTGVPIIINLLSEGTPKLEIGELSPPLGEYCGVTFDLSEADYDAENLNDDNRHLIDKTLIVSGRYESADGKTGNIHLDTGARLESKNLQISPPVAISKESPSAEITIRINYKTWFDAVDLSVLESESSNQTDPTAMNTLRVLQNITRSIHQVQ